MDETELLKKRIQLLENLVFALVKSDKYYFGKHIVLADGLRISGSTGTGVRIGNSISEKWSFYGVAPVDQPAAITDPTGGATIDTQARTAIIAIIDALQELGLLA